MADKDKKKPVWPIGVRAEEMAQGFPNVKYNGIPPKKPKDKK